MTEPVGQAALPAILGPLHLQWFDSRSSELYDQESGVQYRKTAFSLDDPWDDELYAIVQCFMPTEQMAEAVQWFYDLQALFCLLAAAGPIAWRTR